MKKAILVFTILGLLTTSGMVYAEPSVKQTGQYEFEQSSSSSSGDYTTSDSDKNTVLVKAGTVNFSGMTISKSGDSKDNEDTTRYGMNAAVLSINSGKAKFTKSEITSSAKFGSAVFAYGDSTINLNETKVHTTEDNSAAITVADGGTVNTNGAEVTTDGEESPVILFGKGGGAVNVKKGKYQANNSEGAVIADDGKLMLESAEFSSKGSNILVDGVKTELLISKNTFKGVGEKNTVLEVKDGEVKLISEYEPIDGDIVADGKSVVEINLDKRTSYKGVINAKDSAKSIKVNLSKDSRIVLDGDSYVSELVNEAEDNSNIFANGYKLFVDGKEVSVNQEIPETWEYDFGTENTEPVEEEDEERNKDNLYLLLGAFSFAFLMALISTISIIVRNKQEKQERIEQKALKKVQNKMKKPWEKA